MHHERSFSTILLEILFIRKTGTGDRHSRRLIQPTFGLLDPHSVHVAPPSIELGREEVLHEIHVVHGSVPRPATVSIHELRQRADRRVGARLMEHRRRDALFVRVDHGSVLNAPVPPVA